MNYKQTLCLFLFASWLILSSFGQDNVSASSHIKLCRFKNDKEYARYYGKQPHFYLNDPEKKFYNSPQVIFVGVNFSMMKLVSYIEVPKAEMIKNKHMSLLAARVNGPEVYSDIDFGKKKVINEALISADTYKKLNDYTWVTDKDYQWDAEKIPALIRSRNFERKEGIGLSFIIEKFSKTERTLSGYWVAFDFSSCKPLLIDYIFFSGVGSGSSNYGWVSYWETALIEAGIYLPLSFQIYLDLAKKGEVELVCD